MRILVTGCTGFIGSNLVNRLIDDNHSVYCISRQGHNFESSKTVHVSYDLAQPLPTQLFPTDLDCIIHAAAITDASIKPIDMILANTVGTLNVLEYGREIGINKFIYISSGAIYGYSKNELSERSIAKPSTLYGISKYQSELLVRYYNKCFSTIILRLSFPYGPGQKRGIIPHIANKIINEEPVAIYDNESPKIVPTYIEDVVNVIEKSLLLNGQHAINVSGYEAVSIKALSLIIGKHLGREPLFNYAHDASIKDILISNAGMKKAVHYLPSMPLERGIENYVNT